MTAGYEDFKERIISEVNGKTISSMEDLLKTLESNGSKYHVLVDDNGKQIS
jgi:hypothetical protein